jgi:hypothetical protein
MADTWFESYSRHACHEDGRAIQSNNPSSVHFPDVQCGFLVPLINVAYTSWLPGAKDESKGPEPFREFIGDAHHGRAPRIRCELQNGRLAGTRILLRVRGSLFLS